MKLFNRLRRWLAFWLQPRRETRRVEETPASLEPQAIYLIGDSEDPWSAALLCPCGCGATILLSLIRDDRPSWRAQMDADGTVTLWPSIWRRSGCCSHFFIRRGRTVWAGPSGRHTQA